MTCGTSCTCADRYPEALDEARFAVDRALSAPGASGVAFGAVPRHGLAQALLEGHLRLPPEAVRVDQPLPGLGLDSLGGIELRMALERRIGVSVPLTAVTEDLTLAVLVQRVAGVLFKDDTDIATAEALAETHEPVAAS